jgi:sugar (pentulose or hexulose) kinase
LWLQIKANLLNRPFWVPASGELACKGAALSCTVGLSLYGSFDEAMEKQTSFCKRVFPRPVEVEKYKEWYLSYRAKTNSTLREGHADYN